MSRRGESGTGPMLPRAKFTIEQSGSEMGAMARASPMHADRITRDPAIMVGKPVVSGTRIPVELVLAHLAPNPDLEDLFAAYPRLTIEDVKAVLAYAHDAVAAKRKRAARRSAGTR